MILWDPSKKGTAWNQFQIAAGAIVMATGLMFSGCDATHETTVSADQSRREVSEQSGVLSKVNLPPPRLTIPSVTLLYPGGSSEVILRDGAYGIF